MDPPPWTPSGRGAHISALRLLIAGVLGSLPVAWVLGAMPGRRPTVLIETMFRGFTRCALDAGTLHPLQMVCERAGVPLGMHQLDGGLTYPVGGVLIRLGLDPLAAWKLAVLLPLVAGFAALFWLGRRLTGSRVAGATLVLLFALTGTLTARTWNWYWNTVAAVLLPVLLSAVYRLFVRARHRDLRRLRGPALGVVTSVLLIGLEWQYAVVFSLAVAIAALVFLVAQGTWTWRDRVVLLAAGGLGVAAVAGVMRWRLTRAGIDDQFDDSLATAIEEGVDLMALLAPDGQISFVGRALALLGRHGMLVQSFSEGRQLWIAPYLGVGLLMIVAVLVLRRRPGFHERLHEGDERCPSGFLALLVAVSVGSVALSMGPRWDVAGVVAPEAHIASPLLWLWTDTPLRWVRYPWTWTYLGRLTLLLTLAALSPTLLRRGRSWSPPAVAVAALAVVELGSPMVIAAIVDPAPSVATAPSQIGMADPEIASFEATAIPELHRALTEAGGMVTILPWGNTWITPHLGPEVGIRVRNVGIDRNLSQVEAAAPLTREELRDLTGEMIGRLFETGWTDTVVLLDHIPTAESITRHVTGELLVVDVTQMQRAARAAREAERLGYCVERHSWFSVVTEC